MSFMSVMLMMMMLALLVNGASAGVTIRNWTSRTTVVVTASPRGAAEDLLPGQWIQYTITTTKPGLGAMFTMAKRNAQHDVVTVMLLDGQDVALVDNRRDSIDGILLDDKGNNIQTLFINL